MSDQGTTGQGTTSQERSHRSGPATGEPAPPYAGFEGTLGRTFAGSEGWWPPDVGDAMAALVAAVPGEPSRNG